MSQFDSYNEQPRSNFKDAVRNLVNSSMSDSQIKEILKEMLNNNQQTYTASSSQFGDH